MRKSKKATNNKRRAAARAKRSKDHSSSLRNETPNDPKHQRSNSQTAPSLDRFTSRASAFGSSLVHLGVIWGICAGLALFVQRSRAAHNHTQQAHHSNPIIIDGYRVPSDLLVPWTEYPNPLNLTDEDRRDFHPVVKFPKVWETVKTETEAIASNKQKKRQKVFKYDVLDHTTSTASAQLATEEERQQARAAAAGRFANYRKKHARRVPSPKEYSVGRYDEKRGHMYPSDTYGNETCDTDGYAGAARTVHIGMDLGGPLGTKVYAFTDGIVHSAGYNADLGDYGNVIVLEHDLGVDGDDGNHAGETRKVWALYGHLDNKSIVGKNKGEKIKKGQVIGRFGDIHESGGWFLPHVHFQLSLEPPDTHDMPGVVSMKDRPRALVQYPDPRQVLGPMY